MTRLQSGLGPPDDLETSLAIVPLHCVQSRRAQGLGQVSSESGLQIQMPTGARQVKESSRRRRLWGLAGCMCHPGDMTATHSLSTVPAKVEVPML